MEAYQNAALSPEERAKDLLGKMTLQEKVGQLNQRLYGFRIYERQGEEFTLTEEFKEEVERMGGWHYPPERPQRPAGRTQRCLLRQLVRLSSGICSDGLKRQILRR